MSLTEGIPMTMNVAPAGTASNSDNSGWGGNGAWWIVLFLIFAAFGGWGGNGGGLFGGGGSAATQGSLTREQACIDNNFQNLMRETAGISDAVNGGFSALNSTICHQEYETAGLINGLSNNMMQGFNGANIAMLQGFNAIQAQQADCCCKTQSGIEGLKFTIANEDCQTRNLIQSTATAMMTNANDNTRAILDKLTQQELAAKDAQIAAQNQRLFAAELAASQSAQNAYLINTLRPTPVPAYPASSPCGYNWAPSVLAGYGYSNGCGGCGCGVA